MNLSFSFLTTDGDRLLLRFEFSLLSTYSNAFLNKLKMINSSEENTIKKFFADVKKTASCALW